jgi:hypothetical protein
VKTALIGKAAVTVVIAAVALTALPTDGQAWEQVAASPIAPLPPCPDVDALHWTNERGESVDPTDSVRMNTNASIIACPTEAGRLTFTLGGTIAAGVGSRAVLTQGAKRLLDVELRDEERIFEVDIPAAGQLLLAFVNDYYDPPEDRNLWVSGLEFTPRAP